MSAMTNMPPLIFPLDFSGTVVIRKGMDICFRASRGYANRSDHIPNAVETRYALASVSKAFTAVAVLQLVEEGCFLLENEISVILADRLPAGYARGVTVHQLLTHSSGISDYFDESIQDDYSALWQHRSVSLMRRPADFLPMFVDLPMQFSPGSSFRYNNAGYVVLALLVEKFTGKNFSEAIGERVFQKSGMPESGYFSCDRLPSHCAIGYREDEAGWRSNIFDIPPVGNGDGGAWSNSLDLLRFWDAIIDGTLLGPVMRSQMMKSHWDTQSGDGYGYGVWLKDMGNHHAWFLQGCDPGASAVTLMDPVWNISFVVLGNTDFGVWDISAELIDLMKRGEIGA